MVVRPAEMFGLETDEEIGGRAESGRVEETEIFTASEQDGKK